MPLGMFAGLLPSSTSSVLFVFVPSAQVPLTTMVGHGMLGCRLWRRALTVKLSATESVLIRAVVVGDRQRLAIVVRRKVAFRMDGEIDACPRAAYRAA